MRLDAAEFLRQGGYRVQEVANASDAMESLQSKFIVDLLFTDINLGKGMNGIELALWALANLPRIKILVTTGDTLKDCVSRGSGKDIGEAICSQRPARARETRAGDVIILVSSSSS